MVERDSVVIYKSYIEAGSLLKPMEELELYRAIFEYAFNGTEKPHKPIIAANMALIKPQIDANNKRYLNGKKGGRPKKIADLTPAELEEHHRELDKICKAFNEKP